jgi:hypothetical protein
VIKKSSSILSSTQANDQTVRASPSASSINTMNTKTSTNTNTDNIGLPNDPKRRARVAD